MAVGTESERAETVTVDKHTEQLDNHVKRIFGPSATVTGSMGSAVAAGDIRIILDGTTIGSGLTFADALQAARKSAGRDLSHQGDTLVATG